jgi:hypothetical protein
MDLEKFKVGNYQYDKINHEKIKKEIYDYVFIEETQDTDGYWLEPQDKGLIFLQNKDFCIPLTQEAFEIWLKTYNLTSKEFIEFLELIEYQWIAKECKKAYIENIDIIDVSKIYSIQIATRFIVDYNPYDIDFFEDSTKFKYEKKIPLLPSGLTLGRLGLVFPSEILENLEKEYLKMRTFTPGCLRCYRERRNPSLREK